jgi:hypothetical protein
LAPIAAPITTVRTNPVNRLARLPTAMTALLRVTEAVVSSGAVGVGCTTGRTMVASGSTAGSTTVTSCSGSRRGHSEPMPPTLAAGSVSRR